MRYEKSCGAVVFKREDDKILYLIVLNKKGTSIGNWGFPKGHMEPGETESETATREIFEETGLHVNFIDGFRHVLSYSPHPQVKKDAVYFLAEANNGKVIIQKSEIANFKWLPYERAESFLTHDKHLLRFANDFLLNN